MSITIIVEGKNDRSRLRRLLEPEVDILCTFGTLNTLKLESLRNTIRDGEVYLYMDNDSSGKNPRQLRDAFPDAVHMYTRKGYAAWKGRRMNITSPSWRRPGLKSTLSTPSRILRE